LLVNESLMKPLIERAYEQAVDDTEYLKESPMFTSLDALGLYDRAYRAVLNQAQFFQNLPIVVPDGVTLDTRHPHPVMESLMFLGADPSSQNVVEMGLS
jgi:hypothetical protein